MPHSGTSSQSIIEGLRKEYGLVETKEFSAFEKNILTVTVDRGSGTYRKSIFIYVRSEKGGRWDLLTYRASNSSELRVETESNGLVVYSKSGGKLMQIPQESLNLKFDRAEQ